MQCEAGEVGAFACTHTALDAANPFSSDRQSILTLQHYPSRSSISLSPRDEGCLAIRPELEPPSVLNYRSIHAREEMPRRDRIIMPAPAPVTAAPTPRLVHERLHEVIFVFVLCLAQFLSLAAMNQTVAPILILCEFFDIHDYGNLSWFSAAYSMTVGTFILPAGKSHLSPTPVTGRFLTLDLSNIQGDLATSTDTSVSSWLGGPGSPSGR